MLALRQLIWKGQVRYAHQPWMDGESSRSREEEEDGPDTCSLKGAWQQVKVWRSFQWSVLVVSMSLDVVSGTGIDPIPGGVQTTTVDNSEMDSPAENMAHLSGLGARDLDKQEISYNSVTKASIQKTSWKHLPLSSSTLCRRLMSLRCNGRGGREGDQIRSMMMGTWKPTEDSQYLAPGQSSQTSIGSILKYASQPGFDVTRNICAVTWLILIESGWMTMDGRGLSPFPIPYQFFCIGTM